MKHISAFEIIVSLVLNMGYEAAVELGPLPPLILVDPRKTELAAFAAIWLAIKPQSDLELINALAAALHGHKAYDSAFVDQFTEGFSLFRYGLSSLDMDRASRVTGLDAAAIEKTADSSSGSRFS